MMMEAVSPRSVGAMLHRMRGERAVSVHHILAVQILARSGGGASALRSVRIFAFSILAKRYYVKCVLYDCQLAYGYANGEVRSVAGSLVRRGWYPAAIIHTGTLKVALED